ncbi:O-acetyl-ADP-ribose deacetylase [Cohnella sp. CFH 77786]|uniref:O-acetyl-ADP-ribose deacetylase n=1 Tax=Cohnella sp. CFH 77786 TaxID=2662265 RepID=UPI001C60A540|nr:O-acetyl-ADP-ribose deacetylase [Cohnella sp. CFH 77786]MBW5449445.1 O-acetyl-ADP-ribose deacetylase [Cohnella sp. CFH 77786]
MEYLLNSTIIALEKGDITKSDLDCIVNAANTSLLGGGGVDGAIHRAGGREILDECIRIRNKQGNCPVGESVITTGGRLKAKFVIHTVGPVWNGGNNLEDEKLGNCYKNSLNLAVQYGLKSISFPNISTGIYKFPKDKAAAIAIRTVLDFVLQNESFKKIQFICFDDENYNIYQEKLRAVL